MIEPRKFLTQLFDAAVAAADPAVIASGPTVAVDTTLADAHQRQRLSRNPGSAVG